MTTDNFRKHTSKNPLQRLLIKRFYNSLLNEVQALKPVSILDAGCGEGFTLEKLRVNSIGENLYGIDIQETAINIGKKLYPHILFTKGGVYELPYGDNSFDVVICTEVLEHLEFPEKALSELYRVTKKFCVLSVPNEPYFRIANFLRGKNITRWGNDIEHIQHWSSKGIAHLVASYFKLVSIKKPFPWTIVVGKK